MRIFDLQKSRIQDARKILRFRSFDKSTPEGRATERKRRVAFTALSSAAAQAVRILVTIVTVPLLLTYLGNERYGMWLTMSSVIALTRFADFGLGNGLLNAISEADGREDRDMALRAISSALLLLSIIALVLGTIFTIAYTWIPWARVFNVSSSQAIQEAGPAIAIFAFSVLINMPLVVAQKTQLGYQEGFWNDLWLTIGNLLGLAGIVLGMQMRTGTPGLILALVGAPIVAMFINYMVLFNIRRPWLRPKLNVVSRSTARKIANLGAQFFVLQITVAVAYTLDRIVIAQIMGAEMVPQYAIPHRLFGMVQMLIGFFLIPLWPAYGEALAHGDMSWVRTTLFRTMWLTLLFAGAASITLVVIGRFLIDAWVGQAVQPDSVLLLGLGLWTVLSSVGNAVTIALNGMGAIRIQVVLAIMLAPINLVLSILLTFRFGVAGPIWGSVFTYTLLWLLPLTYYLFFKKMPELDNNVA